jgi:hypothetical protein
MIWVGLGRRGVEFRCAGDKDRSCGDDGRRKDKASSKPMRGKVSEY